LLSIPVETISEESTGFNESTLLSALVSNKEGRCTAKAQLEEVVCDDVGAAAALLSAD